MRCELNRVTLLEALGGVTSALPGRTTYPILQNVQLEVTGGRLALFATDSESSIRRELPLEGKSDEGRVLVHGRKLLEFVRESRGETVQLSDDGSLVQVESGRARAQFVRLDPDEFPKPMDFPEGAPLELPLATMFELFDACSFAVARDESRPAMAALNWEVSKTEMRMVATDGHRLAFAARKLKTAGRFKALVLPKTLLLLPRGGDTVAVTTDPARVGFRLPDTTVISRVIEGPYPDYERVLPKAYAARAVVNRELLTEVLRRAAVLAHPVGRSGVLEFGKGRLTVRAETPETGRSEEVMECEYSGEELRIGFNIGYIQEMLKRIDSEKVAVELSTPLAPGVLKPAEPKPDFEQVFLLMPVRLD